MTVSWPGIYSGTSPWGDPVGPAKAVPLSSTMKLSDGFFGINFTQGGFGGNGIVSHGPGLTAGLVISSSQDAIYTFTISMRLVNTPTGSPYEGLVRLTIDQVPIDAADGSGNFTLQNATQSSVDLVFKGAVLTGEHLLTVWLNGQVSQTFVEHIDIAFDSSLPAEPAGNRDGTLQAMSSYHMFNTAIGSGATWSDTADADTQALITGTHGVINSAQFSNSIYTGQPTDPVQIWRNGDAAFAPCADSSVHMPAGMVPGPPQVNVGGDAVMCLFDVTQPRWFWSGFSIVVNQVPTVPGVAAGRCQISDQLNGFNHAWGQGSGYTTPGTIRAWEVLAGAIKHMLILGMPNQLMRSVTTPWTGSTVSTPGFTNGLAWPAWETDFNGAFGQYGTLPITGAANNGSGLIRLTLQYGSTALKTGQSINVSGVTGTTEANGTWTVTVIDATHVDLQGSAFVHAYVSGGFLTGFPAFQYGSTVGIPAAVDITSLGLSAGGLILARCLQDYGATQQVTGGSPNAQVTIFHEVNTSTDSTLFGQMQTDWATKIIPSLRIMRNQGPNNINGGGTRRQALQPGVSLDLILGVLAVTEDGDALSASGVVPITVREDSDTLLASASIASPLGPPPVPDPFDVRIFGYRGVVQAQRMDIRHNTDDTVFFLEEPYLWSQKLRVSDGVQTTSAPVSDLATSVIQIEVDDGFDALLEVNGPTGGRAIDGSGYESPIISGTKLFPWGPGYSVVVAAVTPPRPIMNTDLILTPFSPTQINLSWTNHGGGATYNIYRDSAFIMSSIGTSYYDGGLAATSTHSYTVDVIVGGVKVLTYGPAATTSLPPQPQNSILYSQDFAQSSVWVNQQGTIDATLYMAPDGSVTANALIESNGAGIHQVFQAQALAAGSPYTFSVYAKAGGRTWLSMNVQDSSPRRVLFDLVNGVVGAFPGGNGVVNSTAKMTDVGGGWWRCEMESISDISSTGYAAITSATGDNLNTNDNSTIAYTGNGALALYLWGAQMQIGNPATPYVETLGSPVTISGPNQNAPAAPISVYSIPTSSSSTSVTWNPATAATVLASYEIFRNNFQLATIPVGPGAPSTYPVVGPNPLIGSGLGNWYYDTGLAASTVCKYYVRSVDTEGNRSGLSVLNSCSTVALADPDPTLKYLRPATLPEPNPTATTLRAKAATNFGLYFGSMIDPTGDGFGGTTYDNLIKDQFNLMTPGNQFKWAFTEPAQATYVFTTLDPMLTFAAANNLKVRGHNLLWGVGNPAWLANLGVYPFTTFTGPQLSALLVNHINAVVGHAVTNYPGLVITWDVTNEIMGWSGLVDTTFSGDPMLWVQANTSADGLDYVRLAFNTAHAADPNAILCMNDYGNGGTTDFTGVHGAFRSRNMLNLVRYLLIQGTPIHSIGFESHHEPETYDELMAVMKEYRDMGLSCQVTECDFVTASAVVLPAIDTAAYAAGAAYEGNLLAAALDSPNCTVFNLWGFDGIYPALSQQAGPGTLGVYPYNTLGNQSEIYTTLYNYLAKNTSTPGVAGNLLLADGTSRVLQTDATSKVKL